MKRDHEPNTEAPSAPLRRLGQAELESGEVLSVDGNRVAGPTTDANGFVVYSVRSPYQRTTTSVRVLLPSHYSPDAWYRVIYVLPCEAGNGTWYGDGLLTVKSAGLHETRNTIFVAPTFSDLPWYCDNASNSRIWQETYFRDVVVPMIEHLYPVTARPEGRLLMGFSKSGYGAWSMLLRNPGLFGRATAWDSPLAMTRPRFGFAPILGSAQNFENYRISSLLGSAAPLLRDQPPRLFLSGYSYLRSHLRAIDRLMNRLGIPHVYDPGTFAWHRWGRWVNRAVDYLLDGT
jgi:hypothetical protein